MSAPLPISETRPAVDDEVRRQWLRVGVALAAGLAVLAVTYAPEIAAAVRVWIESTTYSHCFLVLPVAAYLLYQRWDAATASVPQPAPWLAAAAVPVALAWLVAERVGIMEARQLLAMTVLQLLVMATFGPRTWWALAAPLLYLFFLVPVGEFTTPWLQALTVRFIAAGLDVLRIPHFVDGVAIEIPEGRFLVAEACAGLRFVMASAAFGAFYACVVYVSPIRRLLFVILSIAVPVAANGLRALGIVVLGHALGSADAAAVDHVLYGWLFFAIVTTLLILAGLPFRQAPRQGLSAGRTPHPLGAGGAAAAVLVIAIAAVLPRLVADGIDGATRLRPDQAQIELPLAPPAGCEPEDRAAAAASQPGPGSSGAALTRSYRCVNHRVRLHLMVFPPHTGADPVFAALRGSWVVPGSDEVAVEARAFGDQATRQTWRVVDVEHEERFVTVSTALWIDGRPSPGGISSRFRLALAALRPDVVPPAVAVVESEPDRERERARAAVEAFLREADATSSLIPPPQSPAAAR